MAQIHNSTELAWAAGFFDGEGCTTLLTKGKNSTIRLAVAQKHPEVLYRFNDAVGCGRVYLSEKVYADHKTPMHRWQTTNHKDTMKAMGAIWSYLGIRKREQFLNVLEKSTWHNGAKDKLICREPGHIIEKRGESGRRCRTCKLEYGHKYKRKRDIIRFASRIALGYSHPRMFGYRKKPA